MRLSLRWIAVLAGLLAASSVAAADAERFAFYELDGTWGVEGYGVAPDMEVWDDPSLMVDGGDPQLEAAITHLLKELERNPPAAVQRPASPDRSGSGPVLSADR